MPGGQELVAALKEHGVVPDVIDGPSPTIDLLQVKYPNDAQVRAGKELTATEVTDRPTAVLPSIEQEGSFLTLMMIDPDAPSRADPSFGEILHWLVVNIPAAAHGNVSDGETVTEYIGCGAPEGTGLHRYIFLAFKQSGKLDTDVFDDIRADSVHVMPRRLFKTRSFAAKHNLGVPIAASFFQAQYDESVPKFRATFVDRQ